MSRPTAPTRSPRAHAAEKPDRRIVERRSQVEWSQRRRLLARLGIVAIVLALVASGIAVLHSPLFAARHVSITITGSDGHAHETDAAIHQVTGLTGRPPLIDIDTGRDVRALEALPYVATATVSRSWPSTVSISITERTPVGDVALAHGVVALVDGSGRVLATTSVAAPGLLRLAAVGHVPAPGGFLGEAGKEVATVATAIPASLRSKVAGLRRSPSEGVVVTLAPTTEVLIGTVAELPAKFEALATLIARQPAAVAAARLVDLRVPSAPVLTP